MRYTAEAPAKVILTGEHFVVHGARAVVATVPKRVRVEAEPSSETRLVASDLGIEARPPEEVPKPLSPLVEAVEATRKFLGTGGYVKITIRSQIPVAQGLGSSGAVAVATVAAAAAALGHVLPGERVAELAMVAERMVHGNPSGIDISAPIHGGILLFRRGETPRPLSAPRPLTIVLGYSGIERSTAQVIAKVSSFREASPSLFASYAEVATWLGAVAAAALQTNDIGTMGLVLNANHALLQLVGASSPVIDHMVESCLEAAALGAKVTGGGGGGAMIALPREGDAEKLSQSLAARGFRVEVHQVPAEGLRVWAMK